MKVIVDTSVWSQALRRKKGIHDPFVNELQELIREDRVQIIGPIRQEILSGVRSHAQYKRLRDRLRAFPDFELTISDYELAAQFFNTARTKGIQGANTDFLICAVSSRYAMPVLTIDDDFTHFQRHIPVTLHTPRDLPNMLSGGIVSTTGKT